MQKGEHDAEKLIGKRRSQKEEIEKKKKNVRKVNYFFLKLRRCVSRVTTLHIQPSSTQKFKSLLEYNLCTSFALFTSLNIDVLHLIIVIYLCFIFVGAIILIGAKIELQDYV